ncbi:MAG: hypothetical protein ABI565_10000, partial [Vicinamibacteria bacterium]
GARVVPHAADELGRLDPPARRALLEALRDVETADARALKKRLMRLDTPATKPDRGGVGANLGTSPEPESRALDELRALPPPRPNERAAVSRERGEAHLALARRGSRLARKDLLLSLNTLAPERARLYCEAAGLIGDGDFLTPLARAAAKVKEATRAIAQIATREKITPRSKVLRTLDEPVRVVVARALAGPGPEEG